MKTFRVQARVAAFVGAIVLLVQVSQAQAQTFVFQFGSYGSGDGQFNAPAMVAVDAAGNIYVADRGNHRIQVFDSLGNFLLKFGSFGYDNGQFYGPAGVAVDASGYIIVTDKITFPGKGDPATRTNRDYLLGNISVLGPQ